MKKLILPYVFFQLIYSIFYYFLLSKDNLSIQLLDPEWSLWFLLSLFFWNVMLFIFAKSSRGSQLASLFSLDWLLAILILLGGI